MQNYIRYAIYSRVAIADSYSEEKIQEQVRMVEDYLALTDIGALACVYRDQGISDTATNRPGLDSLFADAEAGEIDTVLCTSEDRLGNSEICDLILDKLEKISVKFVAVDRARHCMDEMFWSQVLLSAR